MSYPGGRCCLATSSVEKDLLLKGHFLHLGDDPFRANLLFGKGWSSSLGTASHATSSMVY